MSHEAFMPSSIFGQPGITEIIVLRGLVAVDGLEVAGDVLSPVGPPVHALRFLGLGRVLLDVCGKGRQGSTSGTGR